MVGALYFMNEDTWRLRRGTMLVSNDDELKEYVRCAIVNMYMEILKESSCGGDWGLWYAWYTMKQMEDGIRGGLITTGKCGHEVFENIQTKEFDMAEKIKDWLKKNPSLTDKIGGQGIDSTCRKSLAELDGVTPGKHKMGDKIKMQPEEQAAITTLGQELKVIVEQVKTAAVQCAQTPGPCMEPSEDDPSSAPENADSKAIVPHPVNSGIPAPNAAAGKDRWQNALMRPPPIRLRTDASTTTKSGCAETETNVAAPLRLSDEHRGYDGSGSGADDCADECGGFTEFMDIRGLYVDSVLQKG
ncbi:hypothetical protein AK88_05550 [Plasmodium fragile]|uniref:Schizont-infected cell agglutination extracellular alpha domain-containing protein n=1 Tax=Plasmodium fragile TaxID=5857 RepID=A0A0D9QCN5_PLAFR|nr:uncharacterized protein AK88_05550 [Plasmodium fragile]KJP84815.1 hypothetical protein AK88_05550 [Plasmodium fragile]